VYTVAWFHPYERLEDTIKIYTIFLHLDELYVKEKLKKYCLPCLVMMIKLLSEKLSMEKKVSVLESKIENLETHIKYLPGGEGYEKARSEFENCKLINSNFN
jgi:hypothetical protein